MPDSIARREYVVKGTGERIQVSLGKPEKLSGSTDYYCPYKITAFGTEAIRQISGIDEFKKAIQLEWEGGSLGDTIFPE